jgi:CelD/BcsL family acetyltransferase involved in cellulose biosynthesis
MCAKKKWLRMGIIYLDDQPIAAQVWIVNSGKATIYKLAHDQKYDEYSSGSTLTTHLIQHVLEVDKVREIDFGSGDDPYKKNWLSQRRERWGILAMNPRSLTGWLGIARNIGGRAAKNAWQTLRRSRSGHKLAQVKSEEES